MKYDTEDILFCQIWFLFFLTLSIVFLSLEEAILVLRQMDYRGLLRLNLSFPNMPRSEL